MDKKEIVNALNECVECYKKYVSAKKQLNNAGVCIYGENDSPCGPLEFWLNNGIDQLAELTGRKAKETSDSLGDHHKEITYKGIKMTQRPKTKEEYYLPIKEKKGVSA